MEFYICIVRRLSFLTNKDGTMDFVHGSVFIIIELPFITAGEQDGAGR